MVQQTKSVVGYAFHFIGSLPDCLRSAMQCPPIGLNRKENPFFCAIRKVCHLIIALFSLLTAMQTSLYGIMSFGARAGHRWGMMQQGFYRLPNKIVLQFVDWYAHLGSRLCCQATSLHISLVEYLNSAHQARYVVSLRPFPSLLTGLVLCSFTRFAYVLCVVHDSMFSPSRGPLRCQGSFSYSTPSCDP